MQSPETKSTNDSEHNHYWPTELIPVTPQARRYGYVMDVYVTSLVWRDMCVWSENLKVTHTDKRLYELLEACYHGLGKALSVNDDMVAFTFDHWYMKKNKPKAKKRGHTKLGARLLLHPETGEPWLLLFDPVYDFANQLKRGDPPDDSSSDGTNPAVEL